MELLRLADVDTSSQERTCRESPAPRAVCMVLFAGLAGGAVYWYCAGGLPLFFLIVSGGGCGLFSYIAFRGWLRALSSANWIVSLSSHRVLIKFRSFLNSHLPPDDPQVVSIALSDIRSARAVRQKVLEPGSRDSGSQTRTTTYLDLLLRSGKTDELEEALRRERTVKASVKHHHYPVSVHDGERVRIEWRSPQSRVLPRPAQALLMFGRYVTIDDPVTEEIDCTGRAEASREETDDKILQLAEGGRRMVAIKLVRRAYGMELEEARELVDGLLE